MPSRSPPSPGPEAAYRPWAFGDGPRPVRRLGDAGVDARWLRRYTRGKAVAAVWLPVVWLPLTVGLVGRWGVFGRLAAWQLRVFGSFNPILLAVLFLPLAFLPGLVKWLPITDATPFRLGARQAFAPAWGPRVEPPAEQRAAWRRVAVRACLGVMGLGGLALVGGAVRGYHDATTPPRPLAVLDVARLVGAETLPDAARVDGAVADRSRPWLYRYRVRQDAHVDVYYPLRPPGEPSTAPVRAVELDPTRPDRDPAPWNTVDAPGPREGRLSWLDDWTAQRLREAGYSLAPRVAVLARWPLHGRDPAPDPIDDLALAILGAAILVLGGVMLAAARRRPAAPAAPFKSP